MNSLFDVQSCGYQEDGDRRLMDIC